MAGVEGGGSRQKPPTAWKTQLPKWISGTADDTATVADWAKDVLFGATSTAKSTKKGPPGTRVFDETKTVVELATIVLNAVIGVKSSTLPAPQLELLQLCAQAVESLDPASFKTKSTWTLHKSASIPSYLVLLRLSQNDKDDFTAHHQV